MSSSITAYLITRYNEDGSVSYFSGFVGKYPSFYYSPVCRLYLDFQEAYSDYESLIHCLKRIEREENNSFGDSRYIDFNNYRIIPVTFDISDAYRTTNKVGISTNKVGIYTYQNFLDEHELNEALRI